MRELRGVLLDIDGTLVDSNDAHTHAWVQAFAEHGFSIDFDVIRKLIGMGGDKLLPKVVGMGEETRTGAAITKRRRQIFITKYLPHLAPTRGAKELLQYLKRQSLRLMVATSANNEELTGLLKVCGADEVVHGQTSADDAENSKPDPDIVHAALRKIALPANEVLMLGDTPYDIEAAGQAGVGVVAFRCGGWDDAGLEGARAIYDHPADLLLRYETSPLSVATV